MNKHSGFWPVLAVFLFFVGFIGLLAWAMHQDKFPGEGEIVKKWHEDARQWVVLMPICTNNSTILIPMLYYDDEDFCISVQWVDDNEKVWNKTFYLTQEEYDKVSVGDWWIKGECLGCENTDYTVKRRKR